MLVIFWGNILLLIQWASFFLLLLLVQGITDQRQQENCQNRLQSCFHGWDSQLDIYWLIKLNKQWSRSSIDNNSKYIYIQIYVIDSKILNYIQIIQMKVKSQGGGLLGILQTLRKNKSDKLKILVLGLDNSGKTTILKSLGNQEISNVTPTTGFNIKNIKHENFELNVWDIGGQKALREYWTNYIENIDGLIYVVDSADIKRIQEAGSQLQHMLAEDQLKKVPLLIFANKQDLVQAVEASKVLQQLKMKKIEDRTFTVQACSAKTQEGLEQGITWLTQQIKAKK